MALPTRDELLTKVDARFRELIPTAPARLDPNDSSHAEMIDRWWDVYHEVLSKMTDEAFFTFFPNAPEQLDPSDSNQATLVEYWKDIAAQISGEPGRHNWAGATPMSEPGEIEMEPIERPAQDGSVQLEDRIHYVHELMRAFAEAVGSTPLGPKVLTHTTNQIETLRGLVRDGTFSTYDHWWRSLSFGEVIYDPEDRNEELAFVRDLTLEAKIDRTTGVLDTHLAGWATDFKKSTSFGRVSRAGE
jgi:hypothetical protein